jgi:hypothetical protein
MYLFLNPCRHGAPIPSEPVGPSVLSRKGPTTTSSRNRSLVSRSNPRVTEAMCSNAYCSQQENHDDNLMNLKSECLAALLELLGSSASRFETAAQVETANGRTANARFLETFALQKARFQSEITSLTHEFGVCIDHQCETTFAQPRRSQITTSEATQSLLPLIELAEDQTLLAYERACHAGFAHHVLRMLEHQFSEVRITRARVITLQETASRSLWAEKSIL